MDRHRLRLVAVLLVGLSAAVALGSRILPLLQVACAEAEQVRASARSAMIDGTEVGEVVVGTKVVFRLRTAAGDMPPTVRAQKIAERLDAAIAAGLTPSEIHAGPFEGDAAVLAERALLVTVGPAEAQLNHSDPQTLAQKWAVNLAAALGGKPGPSSFAAEAGASGTWTASEPYKDKIVPILSIGQGKRIGAARVNGPSSKIDLVQAVAQLETSYKQTLEINVYIPISTKEPGTRLTRVQSCAITAIGDLRF